MIIISKNSFARVLTLLRAEKKISQKKVAEDLGISQALLSHYEKGIRECKLDFVVKVADYYDVSIDYLLGRAPEKNGLVLSVDDIPDIDSNAGDKKFNKSIFATLNKKLIVNSLNIIFDILQNINNKSLIKAVSNYLFTSIYKMFRAIFVSNKENPESFFSLSPDMYVSLTSAFQSVNEAKAVALAKGHKIDKENALTKFQKEYANMSPETISQTYPDLSSSINNLIKSVEKEITENQNF